MDDFAAWSSRNLKMNKEKESPLVAHVQCWWSLLDDHSLIIILWWWMIYDKHNYLWVMINASCSLYACFLTQARLFFLVAYMLYALIAGGSLPAQMYHTWASFKSGRVNIPHLTLIWHLETKGRVLFGTTSASCSQGPPAEHGSPMIGCKIWHTSRATRMNSTMSWVYPSTGF